jgi:hypothetical protein
VIALRVTDIRSEPPNAVTSQLTSVKDTDMNPINARGASGRLYSYYQGFQSDSWQNVPINYMFAFWNGTIWVVRYIGQAENAATRMPNHERWNEAVRSYGATHVLNHVGSQSKETRETEERDLILSHNPPMNVQHKPSGALRSYLK